MDKVHPVYKSFTTGDALPNMRGQRLAIDLPCLPALIEYVLEQNQAVFEHIHDIGLHQWQKFERTVGATVLKRVMTSVMDEYFEAFADFVSVDVTELNRAIPRVDNMALGFACSVGSSDYDMYLRMLIAEDHADPMVLVERYTDIRHRFFDSEDARVFHAYTEMFDRAGTSRSSELQRCLTHTEVDIPVMYREALNSSPTLQVSAVSTLLPERGRRTFRFASRTLQYNRYFKYSRLVNRHDAIVPLPSVAYRSARAQASAEAAVAASAVPFYKCSTDSEEDGISDGDTPLSADSDETVTRITGASVSTVDAPAGKRSPSPLATEHSFRVDSLAYLPAAPPSTPKVTVVTVCPGAPRRRNAVVESRASLPTPRVME